MSEVGSQTPLYGYISRAEQAEFGSTGLQIIESDLSAYINLRGDASQSVFRESFERVIGLTLPTEPHGFQRKPERLVVWLGPNEWLVRVSDASAEQLERELRASLSGHHSVVDVSGGYTTLSLLGDPVVELLKKSCVYDIENMPVPTGAESSVQSGKAVQTVFAKAGAIVARQADDAFELIIRRSFSDYIAAWLEDASAEWGGRIQSSSSVSSRA